MGWVTLDDNFPNHPKTINAGPVAAYLYICGLCYCRKFHTSGFIPAQAVKTLGVSTNPRRMIDALIAAGFWLKVEGGFQVHDYAAIYPDDAGDKAQSEARRQQKREAGRKGGQASWAKRSASSRTEAEPKQPASNGAEALRGGIGFGVVERRSPEEENAPLDEWLRTLQGEYPQHRVTRNYRTEQAFVRELLGQGGSPAAAFTLMRANLALNIASHEWRVKGYIPKLENYLADGLWLNVLPADPPAAERVSKSTSITAQAMADALRDAS